MRTAIPPGPWGIPWMGNRHQLPPAKPWRKFTEWSKSYGPVMSFFLGSTPVIVLGTAETAWDLLEKRSEIYSSRPRSIMGGEILSGGLRGLMLPNNEAWRKWRKVLHSGFHARRAETYKDIQSLESNVTLHEILHTPEKYERHIQRYAASVVTSVTYGRRIESMDEYIVKENMVLVECEHQQDYLSIPGKYLVESWPWLLKLPRSLQWFRREPEARRQKDIKFLMELLDDVKARMKDGTVPECLTAQTISNMDKNGLTELEVAYSVSSSFGAGIETTAGSLSVFILAMLHFPDVMRKAQAELDAVVGSERMPEFEDKSQLPYTNALIDETLRWRPVTAIGGPPHAVTADDEYNGMFIPKGSTVFANLHGIMRDPVRFPSPEEFLPERFIESTLPRMQPFDLPFGFGRRICPGMHLALNSLFINVARILWAFDVLPQLDDKGQPILPVDPDHFTNGFNSKPVSFDCRLVPRSQKTVECIESGWQAAKSKLAAWQ
ncbi:cytochrome P450 [Infundibulicybe gibba]|nr:cytochrome P450 [Infundibulicybe gibba]